MTEMRIGITERGDAGIDFSWHDKLARNAVDGAVVITKKLSSQFNHLMLTAAKPVVLHCTCTGQGGTWLEPNVPAYQTQLMYLRQLIDAGFPASRVVLRIDPVIPDENGIRAACAVLDHLMELKLPVTRVRFSVYDEYRHVKDRLRELGREPFYPDGAFYASSEQKQAVVDALSRYPYVFESCAEDWAAGLSSHFVTRGCVSETDIRLMGLELPDGLLENMQHRAGCHCLSCKTELLTSRAQCPNRCMYCYWKPTHA